MRNCTKLYVDWGGNNGQSLLQWYSVRDAGHGVAEFAQVVRSSERRTFCAEVFEPNPVFHKGLRKEAARFNEAGTRVAIRPAAISIGGGELEFAVQGGPGLGSSLVRSSRAWNNTGPHHSVRRKVPSVDAIGYLRHLTAERVVLKVDVENYEFELLRGLLTSGALCASPVSDLLVEWHPPRTCPGCSGRQFDEWSEGFLTDSESTMKAILWMLRSPACKGVRYHRWW